MPCGEPFRFSHLPREMAAASPEDQVALWERNFRDIEDFVSGWPCAGGFDSAFKGVAGLGGTVNAEDFEPAFNEIASVGGEFDVSTAGSLILPSTGTWVWQMFLYWSTYPTLSGATDGMSYGHWYVDVTSPSTTNGGLNGVPFIKSGSTPSAFRYHTSAGVINTTLGSERVDIAGGPQFFPFASVSGDSYWDLYFTIAKVSSLAEAGAS